MASFLQQAETTPNATITTAARTQYLEQQCLLAELQQMVAALSSQPGTHSSSTTQQDQNAEPCRGQEQAAAVASLAKHLQAAALVQQLQLPAVQRQHNPFNRLHHPVDDTASQQDNAEGPHTELLGSKQHVLGVMPQQLRRVCLPSRKAAQRAHAPLLPVLETGLKQHAQAAVDAILGSPAGGDVSEAGSQAVQKVGDTQAELSALQQSNMLQLQQLRAEAAGCLADLDGIHALLQQLVGKCMVGEQPKLSQVQRELTQASMQNCISKLHSMQLQLWCDTYDHKNIQALAEISREQRQMEQQLLGSIEQAESELLEYGQLGDEFDGIVQEYGDVLARIQHVDQTLDFMTSLANEAAGAPRF